jgi:hypothetical protein
MFLWYPVMDLARAPRCAPLTARKKDSGYENDAHIDWLIDTQLHTVIHVYTCNIDKGAPILITHPNLGFQNC